MAARAPAATRADFADFYPLQTRWNDNDTYGHMNNVVHYALFDTAVNGWLIERGLLFRNDEENASAEGFFVHVYVNRDDHRPTEIPTATRTALEGLKTTA